MSQQTTTVSSRTTGKHLTPEEQEDRRDAMRETLPGFLYGLFTIALAVAGLVWFLVETIRGG